MVSVAAPPVGAIPDQREGVAFLVVEDVGVELGVEARITGAALSSVHSGGMQIIGRRPIPTKKNSTTTSVAIKSGMCRNGC
jgi:hypothetical protein